MNKIYCIERGSYSDYHIVGIYDAKEKAQTVADYLNKLEVNEYDKCEVVERLLNPSFDEINQGFSVFHVLMLKDGTTERVEKVDIFYWDVEQDEDGIHRIWRRRTAPGYKGQNLPDCLDTKMFAKNEQHAVKIANEKRIFLLANDRW